MWVLRQYRRSDDELAREVELPGLSPANAQDALGFVPTKLGSNPLKPEQVLGLARRFAFPYLKPDTAESFLDFDADVDPDASHGSGGALTTSR